MTTVVTVGAAEVRAGRWHATAPPPRAGLPAVEVELGYDGSYVPAISAPANFRALSAGKPFDGYIGFRTALGERQTPDASVIARAVMRPYSRWAFSTSTPRVMGMASWVKGYFQKHELVVEWRDRDMRLLAQRSVGVPPWVDPPRPLRVTRVAGEAVAADIMGDSAVLIDAASLSTSPQWYGGFSSVVVPTALWFELPRKTRGAIFRSAVPVVFVGAPEQMPSMDAVDRALLPIDLRAEPGTIEIPWPWRGDQVRTMSAAVTWRAKPGATVVGADSSPWLVANAAATFVAGEEALRDPLPSFKLRFGPLEGMDFTRRLPTFAEILTTHRVGVAFTLLFTFSVAAWFLIRRHPRAVVLVVSAVVTLMAIGWRNEIRPAANHHTYVRMSMPAPGIIDVVTTRDDYGPAPLRSRSDEIAAAAGERVVGDPRQREGDDMEVRTSATPPGFGDLHTPGRPWAMAWKATKRRELGALASIHVRSRDADRLVVEYASSIPVDYIAAEWVWNGRRRYGETRATSQRGIATIVNAQLVWPQIGFWSWMNEAWRLDSTTDDGTSIGLLHMERNRTVHIRLVEPGNASPTEPYMVFGPLQRDDTGDLSTALFLPARIPDASTVAVSILGGPAHRFNAERDVEAYVFTGPGGSMRVVPAPRSAGAVEVPVAELQRVVPGRGVLRVSVQTSPSAAAVTFANLKLKVWEKHP